VGDLIERAPSVPSRADSAPAATCRATISISGTGWGQTVS